MINCIYDNIIKDIEGITFDLDSDIYATSSAKESQVEVTINHKNVNKIKLECKRRDLSVFGAMQKNHVDLDLFRFYSVEKDLNNIEKLQNIFKGHDLIIKNVESKIQKAKPQLSKNFTNKTMNIFYLSIDGFQITDNKEEDYNDLSLFMQDYKTFLDCYEINAQNNSPSHFQAITHDSDFNINIDNQYINYIFIAFADDLIIWKIISPNRVKIISKAEAFKEIRSIFN